MITCNAGQQALCSAEHEHGAQFGHQGPMVDHASDFSCASEYLEGAGLPGRTGRAKYAWVSCAGQRCMSN